MARDGYGDIEKHVLSQAWESGHKWIGVIDAPHLMVHLGKAYEHSLYFPDVDDPSGARIVYMPTGATIESHMFWSAGFSAGGRLEVWEDLTITNTGVEIASINQNRTSLNTPNLVVYSGATLYDIAQSGSLIRSYYHGAGGTLPERAPGSDLRERELILNPNKYYMAWFRPDGDNTKVAIDAHWYEH